MRPLYRHIITMISLCLFTSNLSAQGLGFKGNDYPIDKRTSYNVFGDKSIQFADKFNINFDISLSSPSRLGYIVRIKSPDTNRVYNLSYYNDDGLSVFKFNEEGKSSLITADFETKDLMTPHWFQIAIEFNLLKDSLNLSINQNKYVAGNLNLPKKWAPEVCFGRSDHMIDVPTFSIKQLVVSDNKNKYNFPLNESEGEEVHSREGVVFGQVSNPIWLINELYYWAYKQKFTSSGVAGYNYDETTDNVFIFNKDSLITYNLYSGETRYDTYTNACPIDIFLGASFLDSEAQKIYVYEAQVNSPDKPTVAILDLQTKDWTVVNYQSLPMQLHHASANSDQANKRHFMFGGFGDIYYSKELYKYDYGLNRWGAVSLKGDQIEPRYFSSMGYRPDNNSLYIYGGMGNESGEQIVGRQYFYDLYKVDLTDNTASKLWEISWDRENMVPVRGMVIQDDSCFYTLCYPEHFSQTYLRLYRFAFKDGAYQVLGDSIPMRSEKIKTKANLYYSKRLNKLFTIKQEFDDRDIGSAIEIYSLSFPPIESESLNIYKADDKQTAFASWLMYALVAVVIVLLSIENMFYFRSNHRKKNRDGFRNMPATSADDKLLTLPEQTPMKANSVYLFGEFMVRNNKNKDITYMFSTKLKLVFLIILQYSPEGGISSQELSELFWPNRSGDKVKNSRGVTINHLRRILKDIEGVELIYEKGLFKIEYTNDFYCDYLSCIELLTDNNTERTAEQLLEIVSRGKFLKSIETPELDSSKESLEKRLEPILLIEAEKNFKERAYPIVVALCECILYIDPINDEALCYAVQSLLAMHVKNEAKMLYRQFVVEYRKMMGTEYPHAFTDIEAKRMGN